MKKFFLFVCISALLISGCKKDPVPDSNQRYIGNWVQEDTTTAESRKMIINSDGTAEYHSVEYKGATTKTFDVTGYIFFEGYNFKIGGRMLHKKFTADQSPKRVITSMKPYTYYDMAIFNGVKYRKKM